MICQLQTQIAQAQTCKFTGWTNSSSKLIAIQLANFSNYQTKCFRRLFAGDPTSQSSRYQGGPNINPVRRCNIRVQPKPSSYPTIRPDRIWLAGFQQIWSNLLAAGNCLAIGPTYVAHALFDWNYVKPHIKISETDQKIAPANHEKSVQSAFHEVNDALATHCQ